METACLADQDPAEARPGHPRYSSSDPLPPPGDLLGDPHRRGAAEARARADRVLDAEHLVDALVDAGLDRLHGVEGQVFEGAAALLGLGDDPPGDVVGVPEGMPRLRTSQSARSVAVEKPAPATAAMRSGTGSRSWIMPVMAASTISRVSAASKSCSLSSCMSLE